MNNNAPGEARGHRQWDVAGQPDIYTSLKQSEELDHLAVFYDSHEERLDVSLSFLQLGLARNERCLYARSDLKRQEILDGLAALGVDVDTALSEGQLDVLPAAELYFEDGFDPDEMVSRLIDVLTETTARGYDGLRIAGEISWLEATDIDLKEILAYETSFDATAPNFDFCALCQYDLDRLSDEELLGVMQAHRQFVYRRRLCENPLYQEPEEPNDLVDPIPDAERVLETAYDLTGARDAIDRREQRVGVLNRVLRHNLRNDLNVVRSHAELMREASDDAEVGESADAILDATDRLMDIAEEAKQIEKSVGNGGDTRVPIDLSRAIEEAAARTRTRHPGVAVVRGVDEPTWVESSEQLEFALAELFEALASMADDGAKILVEIDEACSTASRRCLVVQCDGADLPKSEVQALLQGKETQLSHGSGLGLWLVNWIVELSGGSLSFQTTDDEERVMLDLVAV